MSKVKIKVTQLAYYNNCLVYPNEIIDYEGDLPSWGTLADGKATKKQETKTLPVVENDQKQKADIKNEDEGEQEGQQTPPVVENDQKQKADIKNEDEGEQEGQQIQEKSETELLEELDALIDESVAKGIMLDNAELMTIDEQIAELKRLLGK